MKAHSVRLSVVRDGSELQSKACTLNETAEAVPGIVRQLMFVAPHISSIFISSLFMSLVILCLLCV